MGWGNSLIARNIAFWKCTYCDKKIKDGIPFQIMYMSATNYIFCSELCEIQQIRKLEAEMIAREHRL